jgi:hypothetical protein
MSKMELFLYDDNNSLFLRLLTNYVNAERKNIVKILSINTSTRDILKLPTEPFLVSQGELIFDDILISHMISTMAGRREDLFSIWNGERKDTLTYFQEFKKEFENLPKFIEKLDNLLKVFTFLNATHITILDIYTYSQIIRHIANLPENEKNKFVNIIRWINHLQNLENLREIISLLRLNISIPFEPLVLLKDVEEKQVGKKAAAKEAAAEKAEFNRKQKELRMAQDKEKKEGECVTEETQKVEKKPQEKKIEEKTKEKEKEKENGIKFI